MWLSFKRSTSRSLRTRTQGKRRNLSIWSIPSSWLIIDPKRSNEPLVGVLSKSNSTKSVSVGSSATRQRRVIVVLLVVVNITGAGSDET